MVISKLYTFSGSNIKRKSTLILFYIKSQDQYTHIKFHKSVKIEYRENTLKTLYLYKATLRSLTVQYEIFTQEPPIHN